ncbi:MAG TPA: hypothetical protein VJM31_04520 [Vicinamibacterales bacterium]|nr:hypothetical protein [Vicinamibacterales bacterium]
MMTKHFLLALSVVPLLLPAATQSSVKGEDAFRSIVRAPNAWIASLIEIPSGRMCAADTNRHHIACFQKDGARLSTFGGLGQGPGELQYPSALGLVKGEKIVVLDSDNYRIQSFRLDGGYLSGFPITSFSDSLTVLDGQLIAVNTPQAQALAVVHNLEGIKVGTIGQLASSKLGYPNRPERGPRVPMNRAYLASTQDAGLVVAYQFMPVVQVWNRDGSIRWTRRLTGVAIDELEKTFWGDSGATPAKSVKRIDGVRFSRVITCVTVSRTGYIIVGLANRTIAVVDPRGNQVHLRDSRERLDVEPQAINHDGSFLFMASPGQVSVSGKPFPLM